MVSASSSAQSQVSALSNVIAAKAVAIAIAIAIAVVIAIARAWAWAMAYERIKGVGNKAYRVNDLALIAIFETNFAITVSKIRVNTLF